MSEDYYEKMGEIAEAGMIGGHRRPRSVEGIEKTLTAHDWAQIEQAAKGCISGTATEWPHLLKALKKLYGLDLSKQSVSDLKIVCKAALIQRKAKNES